MDSDTIVLTDQLGRTIRLTAERYAHILEHPEMAEQLDKIRETVAQPSEIIATNADETVRIYQRHYSKTPVTSKFLLVVIKMLDEDAFVLTAFFSSRSKKGRML